MHGRAGVSFGRRRLKCASLGARRRCEAHVCMANWKTRCFAGLRSKCVRRNPSPPANRSALYFGVSRCRARRAAHRHRHVPLAASAVPSKTLPIRVGQVPVSGGFPGAPRLLPGSYQRRQQQRRRLPAASLQPRCRSAWQAQPGSSSGAARERVHGRFGADAAKAGRRGLVELGGAQLTACCCWPRRA